MKRDLPLAAVVAPALLIVAVVGYFLLVKPKQDAAADFGTEITQLEDQIDAAIAARDRANPRGDETTIRVADLFQLTKAMPDSTDMPGIVLELDSIAAESGVSFSSIAPSPVAAGTGFSKVPINLVFEGNYYDLADFLFRLRNLVLVRDGRLEADGRLFSLDSVSLRSTPESFPLIQSSLTVTAYVYAPAGATDPAAAGTATTPAPAPTTTTPTPTPPADTGQALEGTP